MPPPETTSSRTVDEATVVPAAGPSKADVPVIPPKIPAKKTALATRQDKQLAMLMERQNLFKQAALEAKRSGELVLAKEYLRMAKGIDPLISANKCGVPVDMETVFGINPFLFFFTYTIPFLFFFLFF